MSTIFNITGRLYGELKTNVERDMPQGKVAFAAFTVGSYNWKAKENDFFNCICYGLQAENMAKFFYPKRAVSVSGRIAINRYKNKDGTDAKAVQFTATSVDFPTDGDGVPTMQAVHAQARNEAAVEAAKEKRPAPAKVPEDPDDLPF